MRQPAAGGDESGQDPRAAPAAATSAPATSGTPESVARAICLQLLTARPRTRAQLAEALSKRGVPDQAAVAVLDRFTEVGLIDDAAFAAGWVDSRHRNRGLSARALSAELRQRGVAAAVVTEAVSGLTDHTQAETARALVARRLPGTAGLDPQARLRRLLGMLARKGYPPGVAAEAVRTALAAEAGRSAPAGARLSIDEEDHDGDDDPAPD